MEEYEGEQSDLLVGGAEAWDLTIQETLWILADKCLLNRKKRLTSTKVSIEEWSDSDHRIYRELILDHPNSKEGSGRQIFHGSVPQIIPPPFNHRGNN